MYVCMSYIGLTTLFITALIHVTASWPPILYHQALMGSQTRCAALARQFCMHAGQISVQHEEGTLKLDGWATFKAPARIAVLIRELRQQVDKLLLEKVASPTLSRFDSPITAVMQDLLAKDGF